MRLDLKGAAGIVQLVERPTEKPGAILTRVRVPSAARDFFVVVPVSTPSADSLTVSTQPPGAIACINICAHIKAPKHRQPFHCLDTRNTTLTDKNG